MIREIVTIDENLCDGCGLCVPSCHEGALKIVNGKAKLVSDRLCDGLGACLGHCPRGAIKIERREAANFDESLVGQTATRVSAATHQPQTAPARDGMAAGLPRTLPNVPAAARFADTAQAQHRHGHGGGNGHGGCPGSRFAQFNKAAANARPAPTACSCGGDDPSATPEPVSELTHWPVQLRLLSPEAPVLQGASLLVAADCVPVAYAGFHEKLLKGRAVVIGCPKFDDVELYVQRLAHIIVSAELKEIVVVRMQVPCCMGIASAVVEARQTAGIEVPVREIVISLQGQVLSEREL